MKFKCVWSRLVSYVTIMVILLLCLVYYKLISDGLMSLGVILGLLIFLCLALTPVSVEVTKDSIRIRRVIGSVLVRRSEIEFISLYKSSYSIRMFCSSGFMGYLGWMSNNEIGNYFSYATDENNEILIVTKRRKYLISCEKSELIVSNFVA